MSHSGSAELKTARKELRTGPGLEAIGKTRFGTIILSAASVQRTIPAIKRVVQNGIFDLEVPISFNVYRKHANTVKGTRNKFPATYVTVNNGVRIQPLPAS
jgi:hypothetical protein